MSGLPKALYRENAIPINTSMTVFQYNLKIFTSPFLSDPLSANIMISLFTTE